jgi:2-oxoisovalerate dehydrogenase E2 component (dihydrolipoyl transacylase)
LVPLTYLPFAAYAVAQALMENGLLNGRWAGTGVALNDHVNLGIAVSTEAGLIVPVIQNADKLGVRDLALRAHALIEAARNGKLKLEDVQGGTFTLNNTGALGSVISAPIINHPQAAIMTMEAIIKRPVVLAGDKVVVRSMMNLCMTFDHRVCDGAEAGRFLADVKARLEAIAVSSFLL